MNKDKATLKAELEFATRKLFEERGGSYEVQAFYSAKQSCAEGGISDEEIKDIVYANVGARK